MSSETWFISDSHFGHRNILEYEKEARPFKTLDDMHEAMIDRWNSVVKPKDKVLHLGDFAFGRFNICIAEKLNGLKYLVMGNHDIYSSHIYLDYFQKLYGVLFWEQCILSHVPVHPNSLGSRWIVNIHGHTHSKKVKTIDTNIYRDYPIEEYDSSYINVSCEQNNLTPINAEIIKDEIKLLKQSNKENE